MTFEVNDNQYGKLS